MEKGMVKSYDQSIGRGMIARLANTDVRFFSDGVIGKGRNSLKQGDSVWFEIDNIGHLHTAINIRICM
jgi:cold shock CspA family protein